MEFYPVDRLTDVNPELIEQSAKDYMSKLCNNNPKCINLSGFKTADLKLSDVGFVPIYGVDIKQRILAIFSSEYHLNAIGLYLLGQWWTSEDILKTTDPTRTGLLKVKTAGERIVLYVLNRIIYRTKEMDKDDSSFLCHGDDEEAKILWKDGDAIGFYSVKSEENVRLGYIPVMETIFIRKHQRGKGYGLLMLKDFTDSFKNRDVGLRCPLSPAMYKVCKKYLSDNPMDSKLLWEVKNVGGLFTRTLIASQLQTMELKGNNHGQFVCKLLTFDTEDISAPMEEEVTNIKETMEYTEVVEEVFQVRKGKVPKYTTVDKNGHLKRKKIGEETEVMNKKSIRMEDSIQSSSGDHSAQHDRDSLNINTDVIKDTAATLMHMTNASVVTHNHGEHQQEMTTECVPEVLTCSRTELHTVIPEALNNEQMVKINPVIEVESLKGVETQIMKSFKTIVHSEDVKRLEFQQVGEMEIVNITSAAKDIKDKISDSDGLIVKETSVVLSQPLTTTNNIEEVEAFEKAKQDLEEPKCFTLSDSTIEEDLSRTYSKISAATQEDLQEVSSEDVLVKEIVEISAKSAKETSKLMTPALQEQIYTPYRQTQLAKQHKEAEYIDVSETNIETLADQQELQYEIIKSSCIDEDREKGKDGGPLMTESQVKLSEKEQETEFQTGEHITEIILDQVDDIIKSIKCPELLAGDKGKLMEVQEEEPVKEVMNVELTAEPSSQNDKKEESDHKTEKRNTKGTKKPSNFKKSECVSTPRSSRRVKDQTVITETPPSSVKSASSTSQKRHTRTTKVTVPHRQIDEHRDHNETITLDTVITSEEMTGSDLHDATVREASNHHIEVKSGMDSPYNAAADASICENKTLEDSGLTEVLKEGKVAEKSTAEAIEDQETSTSAIVSLKDVQSTEEKTLELQSATEVLFKTSSQCTHDSEMANIISTTQEEWNRVIIDVDAQKELKQTDFQVKSTDNELEKILPDEVDNLGSKINTEKIQKSSSSTPLRQSRRLQNQPPEGLIPFQILKKGSTKISPQLTNTSEKPKKQRMQANDHQTDQNDVSHEALQKEHLISSEKPSDGEKYMDEPFRDDGNMVALQHTKGLDKRSPINTGHCETTMEIAHIDKAVDEIIQKATVNNEETDGNIEKDTLEETNIHPVSAEQEQPLEMTENVAKAVVIDTNENFSISTEDESHDDTMETDEEAINTTIVQKPEGVEIKVALRSDQIVEEKVEIPIKETINEAIYATPVKRSRNQRTESEVTERVLRSSSKQVKARCRQMSLTKSKAKKKQTKRKLSMTLTEHDVELKNKLVEAPVVVVTRENNESVGITTEWQNDSLPVTLEKTIGKEFIVEKETACSQNMEIENKMEDQATGSEIKGKGAEHLTEPNENPTVKPASEANQTKEVTTSALKPQNTGLLVEFTKDSSFDVDNNANLNEISQCQDEIQLIDKISLITDDIEESEQTKSQPDPMVKEHIMKVSENEKINIIEIEDKSHYCSRDRNEESTDKNIEHLSTTGEDTENIHKMEYVSEGSIKNTTQETSSTVTNVTELNQGEEESPVVVNENDSSTSEEHVTTLRCSRKRNKTAETKVIKPPKQRISRQTRVKVTSEDVIHEPEYEGTKNTFDTMAPDMESLSVNDTSEPVIVIALGKKCPVVETNLTEMSQEKVQDESVIEHEKRQTEDVAGGKHIEEAVSAIKLQNASVLLVDFQKQTGYYKDVENAQRKQDPLTELDYLEDANKMLRGNESAMEEVSLTESLTEGIEVSKIIENQQSLHGNKKITEVNKGTKSKKIKHKKDVAILQSNFQEKEKDMETGTSTAAYVIEPATSQSVEEVRTLTEPSLDKNENEILDEEEAIITRHLRRRIIIVQSPLIRKSMSLSRQVIKLPSGKEEHLTTAVKDSNNSSANVKENINIHPKSVEKDVYVKKLVLEVSDKTSSTENENTEECANPKTIDSDNTQEEDERCEKTNESSVCEVRQSVCEQEQLSEILIVSQDEETVKEGNNNVGKSTESAENVVAIDESFTLHLDEEIHDPDQEVVCEQDFTKEEGEPDVATAQISPEQRLTQLQTQLFHDSASATEVPLKIETVKKVFDADEETPRKRKKYVKRRRSKRLAKL